MNEDKSDTSNMSTVWPLASSSGLVKHGEAPPAVQVTGASTWLGTNSAVPAMNLGACFLPFLL